MHQPNIGRGEGGDNYINANQIRKPAKESIRLPFTTEAAPAVNHRQDPLLDPGWPGLPLGAPTSLQPGREYHEPFVPQSYYERELHLHLPCLILGGSMLNGFTAQGRALDKVKYFVLGLLLLCKQFNDKVNVSKQAPTYLKTKNRNIKRGSPFKCLGKTLQKSGLEKFANELWCKKMATVFK